MATTKAIATAKQCNRKNNSRSLRDDKQNCNDKGNDKGKATAKAG
jgi:hypothetical protein